MKPKRHISKFYNLIRKINIDGHIDSTNKWFAINDIEQAVHELRKCFEYSGEIKPKNKL